MNTLKKEQLRTIAICLVLAIGTLACYWQVTSNGFVDFDDHEYIDDNPHVRFGLTWQGIAWAFTSTFASNWHPLTWLSHMLDCQLFGLNAGAHHLMNVAFHIANTLLLFFLLRGWTGRVWGCAIVAALFACHPLHVESVAWASERKDVLSTLFFLLTLLAYTKYVREADMEDGARRSNPLTSKHFLLALLWFALGLMSKPMLVTLPFVLLLLDYWPLGRVSVQSLKSKGIDRASNVQRSMPEVSKVESNNSRFVLLTSRLLFEKLPFFILTLIASIVTYLAQRGAASSLESLPLGLRVSNAVVAYVRYLLKTFWPVDLAAIYPYSKHLSLVWVIGAVLFLAAVSLWSLFMARRLPYLIVGWLWFLGTLVPTIGLVQVGSQAIADRYMYIPSIGILVLLVWGVSDFMAIKRVGTRSTASLDFGLGVMAVLACAVLTWRQVRYWRDSEALFQRSIEVTTDNYIAYDGLGSVLNRKGDRVEATRLISKSVQLNPRYPEAQYDLGTTLMQDGKLDAAIEHFELALKLNPRFALAYDNWGTALLQQGQRGEALEHFQTAVKLNPDDPEAHFNIGTVLLSESRLPEAAESFLQALRRKPDYAAAHSNLGIVLMRLGKAGPGSAEFAEALRLEPRNPEAHFNLGLALLELNQPQKAAMQFNEAVRLAPEAPKLHYYLALALARQGNNNEAAPHARKAMELAKSAGQTQLVNQAEELVRACEGKEH